MSISKKEKFIILALFTIGVFLRFWNIEFGLPHSFYADEPEIAELAVKYTYEIRDIIVNNNWYKLIPISYVYGTFPTYLLTILTMLYSKFNGIAGIVFDKADVYIFLRSVTAVISTFIIPAIAYLSYRIFNSKAVGMITFALMALNWKLIVHAHYVNPDIYLAVLICFSYLTIHIYHKKNSDTLYTVLTGILFGLAAGTKVTALIAAPMYLYIFLNKKDYRGLFAFCFIAFGAFAFTNPFSLIFANDFAFRIYSMFAKEAGMVFDSVDSNPYKYFFALSYIATVPVAVVSLYGIIETFKNNWKKKEKSSFHLFLLGNVLFYLIFYSLQSRRVDRWMLPVLPIVLMYAGYGITQLKTMVAKKHFLAALTVISLIYIQYSGNIILQFKRQTPKSAAYLWIRDNIPPEAKKLVYTEEGLDPMNKLPSARVIRYEVYTAEAAQYFMPENPEGYDYIVTSTRPMENHKKPEVREAYPFYAEKWDKFHTTISRHPYEIIKTFKLPKPNLIPLSDVYIYKNLEPVRTSPKGK